MATNINTGTVFECSASLPATFDSTTYAALSWTVIGEVIDCSAIGVAWTTADHQAVTRAYPIKLKDTYNIDNVTLTIGYDSADAGAVLLKAALDATASYSFQVTKPSGDVYYITGKVIKASAGAVATGAHESLMVEIAVDPESLVEA